MAQETLQSLLAWGLYGNRKGSRGAKRVPKPSKRQQVLIDRLAVIGATIKRGGRYGGWVIEAANGSRSETNSLDGASDAVGDWEWEYRRRNPSGGAGLGRDTH